MRPRILFVNPRYGGPDGLIILPLDQASAAAYALAHGCEVEVLDLAFEPDDSALATVLEEQRVDLVVLTAITICFRTAIEAAELAKQIAPRTPVALMGEHVTYRRNETLERHPCIDFVISFEAEITAVMLARALRSGDPNAISRVRGISYRSTNPLLRADRLVVDRCIRNPDQPPIENLDDVPIPVKDRYALHRYLERDSETTVVTARGCTHRCKFCHRWIYGRRLRNWSLPRVLDEIEANVDYGFRSVFFQDDVFCHDKERTRRLCDALIGRGNPIEWNCNVRVDDFDPADPAHGRLAALMREAGCYRIFVGIESFDQELLDRSRKNAQVDAIGAFVRFWQDHGIQVHASYIVGLPGDSEARIRRRVELAVELDTDMASFNRIFPHPGTPYGDKPESNGLVVPDPHWYERTDWRTSAVAGTEDLAPEQVYELQQWALAHYTESFVAA